MNHYSSIEKITNAIEWTPKRQLEDGIDATLEWWQHI